MTTPRSTSFARRWTAALLGGTVLLFTGCEQPDMADAAWDDTGAPDRVAVSSSFGARTSSATAKGTVPCGTEEDIYENASGRAQCKTINVQNNCRSMSELYTWYEDGDKIVVEDVFIINGGKTRATDVNIRDGGGATIDCGSGEEGKCCSYTIESCNQSTTAKPFDDFGVR